MHAIAAVALAVFLVVTGVMHFLIPDYFRTLVPAWLGWDRFLVAVSGVIEIVVGALLLIPGTRSAGGWAAAALITCYLVSHVDALRCARPDRPRLLERPAGAVARLAVNVLYVAWAVAVAAAAT
ncbi:MauE/DoxX family redox-associated membrane protein [Streptomyces sp. PA5.6]|uniref:DoxX family protein n=1 Tax=Streptomyces sp. PA5.6 TaxID=3035651 RepID=UPI0039049F53